MRIEHLAMNVPDPARQAEWWCANLGARVVRSSDAPVPARFLADSSGSILVELYRNDAAPVPDYASLDPLVMHVAFVSADVRADRDRLVAAGATVVSDAPAERDPGADEFAILRDPWGVPLQIMKRAADGVGRSGVRRRSPNAEPTSGETFASHDRCRGDGSGPPSATTRSGNAAPRSPA